MYTTFCSSIMSNIICCNGSCNLSLRVLTNYPQLAALKQQRSEINRSQIPDAVLNSKRTVQCEKGGLQWWLPGLSSWWAFHQRFPCRIRDQQQVDREVDTLTSAGTSTSSKVIPRVSEARCPMFHSYNKKRNCNENEKTHETSDSDRWGMDVGWGGGAYDLKFQNSLLSAQILAQIYTHLHQF